MSQTVLPAFLDTEASSINSPAGKTRFVRFSVNVMPSVKHSAMLGSISARMRYMKMRFAMCAVFLFFCFLFFYQVEEYGRGGVWGAGGQNASFMLNRKPCCPLLPKP